MLHQTQEIRIDLVHFWYVPQFEFVNHGKDFHFSITMHLYINGFALNIKEGSVVNIHWCPFHQEARSYSEIDGAPAYSYTANSLTIELSRDVLECQGPLEISAEITDATGKAYSINIPGLRMHFAQPLDMDWDRTKACSPYCKIYFQDKSNPSTMSFLVCGIYEKLVTGIYVEYAKWPQSKEEWEEFEPIPTAIPVEIGDFDLVNGHEYSLTIQQTNDHSYRVAVEYVDLDGNSQTYRSDWVPVRCSIDGSRYCEHSFSGRWST